MSEDPNILSPEQSRAARGLLNWSQDDLAASAAVGNSTVRDFEAGRRNPRRASLEAMRTALEMAGIAFIAENGGGPGVRLAKPTKS
jgi:DNA-binding transcriptional regulator YiaG